MVLFTAAAPALAQSKYGLDIAAKKAKYDTSSSGDAYSMVESVVNLFLILTGFVFFGYFLYAGLRWMTARGNDEFIQRAKDSMSSAVWGLIIVTAAYALTNFVFNALNSK